LLLLQKAFARPAFEVVGVLAADEFDDHHA
jgi:hypothetical protein